MQANVSLCSPRKSYLVGRSARTVGSTHLPLWRTMVVARWNVFWKVSQVKGYAAVFSKAVIIIGNVISAFEGIELSPLPCSLDCLCLVLLQCH